MRFRLAALLLLTVLSPSLPGIFAPIPEREQGYPLSMSVRTGVGWDSNATNLPEGFFNGSFVEPVESFFLSFEPVLSFNASLNRRLFFQADAGVRSEWVVDREPEQFRHNANLDLVLSYSFSRMTTFTLSNQSRYNDDPERFVSSANDVIAADQTYFYNRTALDVEHFLSARFSLQGRLDSEVYRYEDDGVAEFNDRYEHGASITGVYRLNTRWDVVGVTSVTLIRYDEPLLDTSTTPNRLLSKDLDIYTFLIGANYRLNDDFTVSGRFGISDLSYKDDRFGTDDIAPSGSLTLSHEYRPDAYVSLGVSASTRASSQVGSFSSEESFSFFGNWQHPLTRQLTFGASFEYEFTTLKGRPQTVLGFIDTDGDGIDDAIGPVQIPGIDRDEEYVTAGLSLTWNPRPRWDVILTYDYDLITSDLASRERERSRVNLSVRYSFGIDL